MWAAAAAKASRVELDVVLCGRLDGAPSDAARLCALPKLHACVLRRLRHLAGARGAIVVLADYESARERRRKARESLLLARGGIDSCDNDILRLTRAPPSGANEAAQSRGTAVLASALPAAGKAPLQGCAPSCAVVAMRVELRFGVFGRRKAAAYRERLRDEDALLELERELCWLPGDGEEETFDGSSDDEEESAELRPPRACALLEVQSQHERERTADEEEEDKDTGDVQADRRALHAQITTRWLDLATHQLVAVDLEMAPAEAPTATEPYAPVTTWMLPESSGVTPPEQVIDPSPDVEHAPTSEEGGAAEDDTGVEVDVHVA